MLLYQAPDGYRYNSDSIFLYSFIKKFKPKGEVLDVGCGVGILSALIGRDFKVNLTAVDKQKRATAYAKKNFEINSIDAKVYEGDFLEIEFESRFDFIVSNPPFYSPSVIQSKNDSLNISRYSHHLPLEQFIQRAKKLLKPRGYLIFCYDVKQSDKIFFNLLKNSLQPELVRFIHPKATKEAKLVMIGARSNSKSSLKVEKPFIVFDEKSNYLQEAREAFKEANTHSLTAPF